MAISRIKVRKNYLLMPTVKGLRMDLEAGLQYKNKCFSILCATEDKKEGIQAFLEKRKPNFQGR